jgi:hypothetical protein
MAAKPIPEGYHSVTPYLLTQNAGNTWWIATHIKDMG